mmetsp:Transcript_5706/g.20314  ORF Transcript_5706/g.20314 Transcript_5706/m.20314 type:complete len:323 (-) Transcript_5706:7-975(-)
MVSHTPRLLLGGPLEQPEAVDEKVLRLSVDRLEDDHSAADGWGQARLRARLRGGAPQVEDQHETRRSPRLRHQPAGREAQDLDAAVGRASGGGFVEKRHGGRKTLSGYRKFHLLNIRHGKLRRQRIGPTRAPPDAGPVGGEPEDLALWHVLRRVLDDCESGLEHDAEDASKGQRASQRGRRIKRPDGLAVRLRPRIKVVSFVSGEGVAEDGPGWDVGESIFFFLKKVCEPKRSLCHATRRRRKRLFHLRPDLAQLVVALVVRIRGGCFAAARRARDGLEEEAEGAPLCEDHGGLAAGAPQAGARPGRATRRGQDRTKRNTGT